MNDEMGLIGGFSDGRRPKAGTDGDDDEDGIGVLGALGWIGEDDELSIEGGGDFGWMEEGIGLKPGRIGSFEGETLDRSSL